MPATKLRKHWKRQQGLHEGNRRTGWKRRINSRTVSGRGGALVRKEEALNDFGIVLKTGTHGICKAARFYKGYLPKDKKVPEAERTFVIEGGSGREPKDGSRKITGYWLHDAMKDTIDSYSLEVVLVDGKRISQLVTGDPPPDPTPIACTPEPEEQKPVRRKR